MSLPTIFNMAKARRNIRGATRRVWRNIYLLEWREHRGLTIEGLAEAAGVSPGLISLIENRKSGGSPETLEKLSDALQITVGELFDIKPETGGAIYRTWVRDGDRDQLDRIVEAIKPKNH